MCSGHHFGRGWISCNHPSPPKCHFKCLWATSSGRGWSQKNQPRPGSPLPVLSVCVLCRFCPWRVPSGTERARFMPFLHMVSTRRQTGHSAHCRQSIWNAQNWDFLYWRQGFPLKTPFPCAANPQNALCGRSGRIGGKSIKAVLDTVRYMSEYQLLTEN